VSILLLEDLAIVPLLALVAFWRRRCGRETTARPRLGSAPASRRRSARWWSPAVAAESAVRVLAGRRRAR
jgi:hypothetical protein